MSQVRESAAFISENSKDVIVNRTQCLKIAKEIKQKMENRNYSPATWSSHQLNPSPTSHNVIDWIFTVDTLNFSFWQDEPRYSVTYEGKTWTGYWSMVASINRALESGIPITSPSFWVSTEFTHDTLANIFKSDNGVEVPLLDERYEVLKEAGQVLLDHGFNTFEQVLAQANGSAMSLVDWVTANIPSYNDSVTYLEKDVKIYKRAQILAADLWACGVGKFEDIDQITMFADYRVPQILAVLGCISYSPQLKNKIQTKQILPPGSSEEVEIRGCSIQAVDIIVEEIKRLGASNAVNAVLVDFYLWDTAKEEEAQNTEKLECHRTRSVFY